MRILYLDLDTLRPDHLGCYGYHRNTSPNIDRIASEGMRFDNTYCSDAPCLPSRMAMMMGQFGIHTGAVGHGGTCADIRPQGRDRGFKSIHYEQSLPFMLRQAGLRPTLISPFAERHSTYVYNAGFLEMHNTGMSGMESAEDVTPTALDWIERNAAQDNWYLHINYWDPHGPYRAPEKFGNPFKDEPIPKWLTEEVFEEHKKKIGPHSVNEQHMFDDKINPKYTRYPGAIRTMEDLHLYMDGYDCGIRYMDEHIGQLLTGLEAQGVLDDLVIIVSADHGENMGELGIYGEHGTADNITCRIPSIIRWPGTTKPGSVDTGLHYNLDLAPTLAQVLGTAPHPAWDGRSYADSLLTGEDTGRDDLVVSQCVHVCQRSVRFGPWLYTRTYHDGYHLFPEEMLYNVEKDPHEQHNVAEAHADICHEGAWRLMNWHDDMMQTMPEGYDTDPLWTVMKEGGPYHARGELKTYCDRLEKTGRGWAVEELKKRHPGEF